MDELVGLRLVQRGAYWVGSLRCTKCNKEPINSNEQRCIIREVAQVRDIIKRVFGGDKIYWKYTTKGINATNMLHKTV